MAFCLAILAICTIEDASTYFYMQGSKLCASRNYEEARDCLDKSLYLDPDNADAWVLRGNALLAIGDYNASIESYSHALKLHGNGGAAWLGLREANKALGDYANASVAAVRAAELRIEADDAGPRVV
jgi:tetratricopeptide (TPR) repeat protein